MASPSQSPGGSRFYKSTALRRRVSNVDDVDRGFSAGQNFGKLIGQVMDIGKTIKQNQVANQLMNTQDAPRAALVSPGVAPGSTDDTTFDSSQVAAGDPDPDPISTAISSGGTPNVIDPSINTAGTAPATGGVAELKTRQDFQADQLDQAYKKAQLANLLAESQGTGRYAKRATPAPQGVNIQGGSSSRWLQNAPSDGSAPGGYGGPSRAGGGSRAGKPAPYVGGTGDAENDDSLDDPNKVAADFDAAQGGKKGTYAAFLANLPNLKPDEQGNYTLTDKNGNPSATVLAADVPYWMQRTNAARRAQGLTPVAMAGVPFGQPANPASTVKPGSSADNPIILQSKLQARSLPYGTFVKDPKTGAVYTVDRPQSTPHG